MRDYAEQIARLRECASNNHEVHSKCGAYLSGVCAKTRDIRMQDAADAIDELLKENAELENSGRVLMAAFARAKEKMPQWHPVSKPPKENGRYYVAYEDSVSFLDYFNGKWFFPPRNGIVVEETKESILYWQPFPAPPKEDAK